MNDSLLIRIYSFSYKNGHFGDPAGNGGGFVFDCRNLPNPGRNPDNMSLTGIDEPVIEELDGSPSTQRFIEQACTMIKDAADSYIDRNFSGLMASFGCTGGRHRSVYCAEKAASKLRNAGFNVRLIHWQMQKYDARFYRKSAMILAAGEGTRLRPLTDEIPKALIEAGGKTMLDWTIESLIEAGFKTIAVNAYHLKKKLTEHIETAGQDFPDVNFIVSKEDKLLGTGGGIRKAAPYLHEPGPVMIHNVDVWTDFDLKALHKKHLPADTATLICQARKSSRYLLADEEMKICGRFKDGEQILAAKPAGDIKKLAFSGIHVVSHRLLELLSGAVYPDIIDCYMLLIQNGAIIRAVEAEGSWYDMGTVEKLDKLNRFLTAR